MNIYPDYIQRINKVFVFIDENLDTPLTLATIAKVAHYSPYHFHRIFKAITKETLNAYLVRKRVEKIAIILRQQKQVNLTHLALQYGFSNSSSFSRTFKQFYGLSPSQFQQLNPSKYSKICIKERKNWQAASIFEDYLCNIDHLKKFVTMNAKIDVKEMPETMLAYLTHIGSEGLEQTFQELIQWATPKGLLEDGGQMIRIFHDSYKITDPNNIRMSVGITLKRTVETTGKISSLTLKKGRYLVGRFEIRVEEFEKAWASLFIWMGEHGYQKAEQDPFDLYYNDPRQHPAQKYIVDLCIPIQ